MAKPQGVIPSPEAWQDIVADVRHGQRYRPIRKARRMPRRRNVGSGGQIDIRGLLLGAWTLSEHDPTTGDTITTWYRGPSWQTTLAHDHDVLVVSGGKIFTVGEINIGKNNGIGVLYDDASGAIDWYADHTSIPAAPTSLSTTALPQNAKGLLEAGDGFLWLAGSNQVGRLNASTGAFTHRYLTSSTAASIWQSPAGSGHVLVSPGASSVLVALLDASASEVANYSTTNGRVDVSGNVVATTKSFGGAQVATVSATDLSAISSRSEAGWTSAGDVATDGTNVYLVTGEVKLRALLASNLATDVWNVAPAGMTVAGSAVIVNPVNGYVYTVNGSTTWTVRKHDPSDGSTVWTSSALFTNLPSNSGLGAATRVGFGSDFIVLSSTATGGGTLDAASSYNVVCLNDSDGSIRWKQWDGPQTDNVTGFLAQLSHSGGVHVTGDDRIFVSHGRKQQ